MSTPTDQCPHCSAPIFTGNRSRRSFCCGLLQEVTGDGLRWDDTAGVIGTTRPETCYERQIAALKARVAQLEGGLRSVVNSARPNKRDNPKMFIAWKNAESMLTPAQKTDGPEMWAAIIAAILVAAALYYRLTK